MPLLRFENLLVLNKKSIERAISLKILKASTFKPNGKPLTGDITLGIEPVISFYEIKESDKTEEGEES